MRGIPAASESLVAAKSAYDKAKQAVDALLNAFEHYGNLLSDEARQPWKKNIRAKMTKSPWEDIYGVTHDKTPTKTWDSFMECIMFHLQLVFRHDVGNTLEYYITNMMRKPNRIPILQVLV